MLEYLLQRGEALTALAVLRRPGVSQELVYKFAPVRGHFPLLVYILIMFCLKNPRPI